MSRLLMALFMIWRSVFSSKTTIPEHVHVLSVAIRQHCKKGNCEFTFIQDTRPGATFYVSVEIDSCSADDASFCLRSFHFVWQMNTVNYQLSGSLNDLQLNHETIQYYRKVSTNLAGQMMFRCRRFVDLWWKFFDTSYSPSFERCVSNSRTGCWYRNHLGSQSQGFTDNRISL